MALYFGTTEITNIDNLVPQIGLDITDLWFGETNIYTVWAIYEGTLPATINANGDDMRQYQIWGNVGGVGDVTETGEPTGYKIPIATEKPIIYGFHINPNDPNSYTAVTYLEDAVGKTPAAMGSTAFSYGDWANAFFMPRPCMLKYDGTVDYYLNPNDYSQKADGTPSDYNNLAYGGNAMMEFPLIWCKFVQGAESGEGYFYCSNRKVDDSYKCWSNMDCDGNIIEHFYMPIYNGCTYDGKMRSISGLQLSPWSTTAYSSSSTYAVGSKVNYNGRMWKCITAVEAAEAFDPAKWEQFAFNGNTTGAEEIAQAMANNTTAKNEWYIDQWCDRFLIDGLLVLISKSIDTQGAFGWGVSTGAGEVKRAYITGALDNRGMFYGSTSAETAAIKVFGMENWWALEFRRTAGLISANNSYLYKLTASTADGSTASAYNTNGSGYLYTDGVPASNNYVKQMKFGAWGWLPIELGSYATQYYKDYDYGGAGFASFGGSSNHGRGGGAFCIAFFSPSIRVGYIGTALSCKPCGDGNLSKNLETATTTPIYIGDEPLEKDEYIDYQSQKVFRRTAQVMPPAPAETKTLNGVTITCDGEGRYSISGTATANAYNIRFTFPNFTIPTSIEQGGSGTFSMFNTFVNTNVLIRFLYNNISITTWSCNALNRTSTNYSAMGGKVANTIDFNVPSGAIIDGVISPMITDNGTLPETYIPYLQPTDPPVPLPALPTCEGATIVDYAGSGTAPEKVLLKYRKEGY